MKLLIRSIRITSFALLLFFQIDLTAQNAKKFKIFLDRAYCDGTTEPSADEVFIIVEGRRSDGATYFDRMPGTGAHWDMNDNPTLGDDKPKGDSYSITNKLLFTGDLKDGQEWRLNFAIWEEDGFNSINYQDKASKMLIATGDPIAVGAGVFIDALTKLGIGVTDSDDWMGMFAASVTNHKGKISIEWVKKEGIYEFSSANDEFYPGKQIINMNHDDSKYRCIFNMVPEESNVQFRIKSHWKQQFLSFESNGLNCCVASGDSDATKFEIIRQTSDPNYCLIKTKSGYYVTRNGSTILLAKDKSNSSIWFLENVAGAPGVYRIKFNDNSTYIQIENGPIQLTGVPDYFLSAMWTFEAVR